MSREQRWRQIEVSPKQLLAEGVTEIASVGSALFVLTKAKLHIFHASGIPDRKIDAYGIAVAIDRIERGSDVANLARAFGVDEHAFRDDLRKAGYSWKPKSARKTKLAA